MNHPGIVALIGCSHLTVFPLLLLTTSEFSFGEPPSSTLRLRPSSTHRDWFRDEDMVQARAGRLKPGSFAERNHWLCECCQTGRTYA